MTWARVGDICRLVNGKAFKPSDWSDKGVPIIRIQNLNGANKPFNYWNGPLDRQVKIRAGDVLLAWSGTPGTSFGVHIWERGAGILNQHIFRVDIDEEKITRQWFKYAVNGQLNKLIAKAHGGVGLQHVTRPMVDNLEIPLPSLDEQRRIAAILDKSDDLIRKRKRALELLDGLTQSIFLEMFGDPVSNPKNFPTKLLGEIGNLQRGISKHRPRNDPILLGGPYPLIQTGEVANSEGYIRSYSSTYSEAGLKQSKLWPAGTLCITIAANIAETGILTFQACFPDSVVGFTHEQPAIVQFVRVWLSFLRSTLERVAPAVAQKNINLEILRKLTVAMPPSDMITAFASKLEQQKYLVQALRDGGAKDEMLFTSLQHRAFSGQL